jgi:preprotein translocase subunit SecE
MISKIKKIPQFLKEVNEELKKVNWSTRQELVAAGIIVVITAGLLTTYIFVVDLGLSRLIQLILQ